MANLKGNGIINNLKPVPPLYNLLLIHQEISNHIISMIDILSCRVIINESHKFSCLSPGPLTDHHHIHTPEEKSAAKTIGSEIESQ